jgi:hypothetical protein
MEEENRAKGASQEGDFSPFAPATFISPSARVVVRLHFHLFCSFLFLVGELQLLRQVDSIATEMP